MALRSEVLQDDADALHIRLYPTGKALRVLGWLPWAAVGIYAVVMNPVALVIIGVWAWLMAGDLAYGLYGWEEIVVTGERVVVRRKAFGESVVADVRASEVRAVRDRDRPFLAGKNDHRKLTLEMKNGKEYHFAQKLSCPEDVIGPVTARLRSEPRAV